MCSLNSGLPLNIVFKIPWLFTDFYLTFNRFPDRFGRSILAIFIHQQLENFVQIFMRSDLIFKEKSQTINIRKGMFQKLSEHKLLAIYVRKHSFSNIACNLWKTEAS